MSQKQVSEKDESRPDGWTVISLPLVPLTERRTVLKARLLAAVVAAAVIVDGMLAAAESMTVAVDGVLRADTSWAPWVGIVLVGCGLLAMYAPRIVDAWKHDERTGFIIDDEHILVSNGLTTEVWHKSFGDVVRLQGFSSVKRVQIGGRSMEILDPHRSTAQLKKACLEHGWGWRRGWGAIQRAENVSQKPKEDGQWYVYDGPWRWVADGEWKIPHSPQDNEVIDPPGSHAHRITWAVLIGSLVIVSLLCLRVMFS